MSLSEFLFATLHILTYNREYSTVPSQLKDEDVLPKFSEIPSILTSIRHPRRRAISVGPQSAADAYETLAYREKRRRESRSNGTRPSPGSLLDRKHHTPSASADGRTTSRQQWPTKLNEFENMMGTGTPRYSSPYDTETDRTDRTDRSSPPVPFPDYEEPPDEAEVFSQIKRPRVRYDVEVVTKLIVYSGRWLTRELIHGPIEGANDYSRYCRACGRGSTSLVRAGGLGDGKRVVTVSRINLRFLVQRAGLMNYYRDIFC